MFYSEQLPGLLIKENNVLSPKCKIISLDHEVGNNLVDVLGKFCGHKLFHRIFHWIDENLCYGGVQLKWSVYESDVNFFIKKKKKKLVSIVERNGLAL